jgi:hypothetical protein
MIRDSIYDIRRLVRRHEALLREIATNTRELRKSHRVDAPASILGTDDASQSIFSQLMDSKDSDGHGFETVILNTQVYSNAFSGTIDPITNDKQSDDARDIVDKGFANHPNVQESANPSIATGYSSQPRDVTVATRNRPENQNLLFTPWRFNLRSKILKAV